VAAVKPAPILFVVNSNINAFIQARPAMLKCQVVLRQTVYGFLDYDSYLNCDRAIASFKPSTIEDQILSNPRRLKAALTSASRSLVIKAVEDSENISPQRKNWVFEELKPTD
jgi:hypothetical protein